MNHSRIIRALAGVLAALFVSACGHLASAVAVRTVALSGQPIPDMAEGVTYGSFSIPAVNASGQLAFRAGHTGSSILGDEGIWSEDSGTFRLVARKGSHVPGTPVDVQYRSFGDPVINSSGQTAFYARLMGGNVDYDTNDLGIWSEGSGTLALVARVGSHAPGTPSGVNFAVDYDTQSFVLNQPALNDAGQTAFFAALTGNGVDGTNDHGIWSEHSGALQLVARSGSPTPGTPNGVNFRAFESRLFPPALDADGGTFFYAWLTGSGVDATNDIGIWSDRSGTLELVAREGNPAPGLANGINYAGFYSTELNASGKIAFGAMLTGSGDVLTNRGIWAERSGELDLVARTGSQAPGTASGVNYAVLLSPVLNAEGQTAFVSTLSGSSVDGSNDSGIWSEGSGTLELVARKGSHAPGTPDNVNFGSDSEFLFAPFSRPMLNAEGQVAFRGYLTGNGIDETNDSGIWVTDSSGVLRLIAREGDPIEVAPGDSRTVMRLGFATDTGDGHAGFNDSGQLAFAAYFADGSQGIFIASTAGRAGDFDQDGDVDGRDFLVWQRDPSVGNLADWQANYGDSSFTAAVAVPEPKTLALLLASCLLLRAVGRNE